MSYFVYKDVPKQGPSLGESAKDHYEFPRLFFSRVTHSKLPGLQDKLIYEYERDPVLQDSDISEIIRCLRLQSSLQPLNIGRGTEFDYASLAAILWDGYRAYITPLQPPANDKVLNGSDFGWLKWYYHGKGYLYDWTYYSRAYTESDSEEEDMSGEVEDPPIGIVAVPSPRVTIEEVVPQEMDEELYPSDTLSGGQKRKRGGESSPPPLLVANYPVALFDPVTVSSQPPPRSRPRFSESTTSGSARMADSDVLNMLGLAPGTAIPPTHADREFLAGLNNNIDHVPPLYPMPSQKKQLYLSLSKYSQAEVDSQFPRLSSFKRKQIRWASRQATRRLGRYIRPVVAKRYGGRKYGGFKKTFSMARFRPRRGFRRRSYRRRFW